MLQSQLLGYGDGVFIGVGLDSAGRANDLAAFI
jgi:hypothetical protein